MSPSFTADIALRLQQIVAGWRGAERSQPLSALHDECLNAAGPGGRYLLPAYLLLIRNRDETNLRAAIQKANGRFHGSEARFRVRVAGQFDAALVPLLRHETILCNVKLSTESKKNGLFLGRLKESRTEPTRIITDLSRNNRAGMRTRRWQQQHRACPSV